MSLPALLIRLATYLFGKGKIGRYLMKYFKLLIQGEAGQIRKVMGSLGYQTPQQFVKEIANTPQKVVDRLEKLGTEGRRKIAQTMDLLPTADVFGGVKKFTQATSLIKDAKGNWKEITQIIQTPHEPGEVEEAFLSSSWQYWARFEYMSGHVGTLWLMTKFSPKEYMYPNVPTRTWYLMKAATGRDGSGSGSVFWSTYLHRYRGTRTHKVLVQQFNKPS